MIFCFSFKLFANKGKLSCKFLVYKTYRAVSDAPVEILWQKLMDLADVSWHPLFASTNVPRGLIAKPGLIYQVVTRLTPIPIRMFVENVRPQELLSLRVIAIAGCEQRITYQIESTLCGSYISYSINSLLSL
jgi:hypothetical protein